jgi:hypothetical protein
MEQSICIRFHVRYYPAIVRDNNCWAAATKAFAVERRAILSLQKSSAF